MTLDIAAIKARADAATDARFSLSATYFDHVTNMWLSGVHIDGHAVSGPAIAIKGNSVEFCNALRAFIAHARTDIPALLAALEASEAARVKAEQDAERLLTALEDHRNLLKCYVDEFGDVEISMEGFSMPTNTRAIKAEQERDALRNFVADFADTNIAMLPMPHIKHPADEPDKAVSAAEVWEWQNDARRALESKP